MYRLTEVGVGFATVRDLRGYYQGGVYYTPKHGWVAEPVLFVGSKFKTRRAAAEYVSRHGLILRGSDRRGGKE